jgi:type II secretory pathway component PulM
MNKLSKDQIQKLGLSVVGFVVLLYVYFSFFLGPLNKGRETADRTMHDLKSKLATSKTETAKAASLEKQAAEASARFAAMKALNPEGAPIAWFPPRIKVFFANRNIEKAAIRAEGNSAYKEPELAEWQKYVWQIDLPQTDFAMVGKALAELENSEPLLSIQRMSIKAVADNPQFQQVSLTAHSAIMKR